MSYKNNPVYCTSTVIRFSTFRNARKRAPKATRAFFSLTFLFHLSIKVYKNLHHNFFKKSREKNIAANHM